MGSGGHAGLWHTAVKRGISLDQGAGQSHESQTARHCRERCGDGRRTAQVHMDSRCLVSRSESSQFEKIVSLLHLCATSGHDACLASKSRDTSSYRVCCGPDTAVSPGVARSPCIVSSPSLSRGERGSGCHQGEHRLRLQPVGTVRAHGTGASGRSLRVENSQSPPIFLRVRRRRWARACWAPLSPRLFLSVHASCTRSLK